MNNAINCSGFMDMLRDSNEDFESYGYSDVNESLQKVYNSVQAYKARFNDRGDIYDDQP